MKRTNEQVSAAISRIVKKHDTDKESFFTALLNYWLRYDLDQEQCEMLNKAKSYFGQ